MARTAREHEAPMARNMMSNHTDMQDKYCGDCYDIHRIQSQYKGTHKRGGAAEGFEYGEYSSSDYNTCLACRCDWTSCSSPLGLHVSSPLRPCALARKGVRGALPLGRGVWGGFRPPQGSRGVWGAARSPMVDSKVGDDVIPWDDQGWSDGMLSSRLRK